MLQLKRISEADAVEYLNGGRSAIELREKKKPKILPLGMEERSCSHLTSLSSVSGDQRNDRLCPPSPVSKSRELM